MVKSKKNTYSNYWQCVVLLTDNKIVTKMMMSNCARKPEYILTMYVHHSYVLRDV
jgi:hypothetical protein